jgi:hypothetical protein
VTRLLTRLSNGARAVRSPSDLLLVVRMLGWAVVLPVLKARMPLERLVALMWTEPGSAQPDRDPVRAHQVARLSRISHRAVTAGRRDNCLERSLIAYRHLSAQNADPRLVVGARTGTAGIEGHTWVTVDGEPVHDDPQEIATYVPVTVFGAGGRSLPVG